MECPEEERFSREAFVRVDCAFGHRSTLPHAASRTVPVRAVVLTCAERFDDFRKRANPRLAHFPLNAGPVEGADHRLADDDAAEQGASASETPRRI